MISVLLDQPDNNERNNASKEMSLNAIFVTLFGVSFVGTIMIVGIDGDEFTDVPDAELYTKLIRRE